MLFIASPCLCREWEQERKKWAVLAKDSGLSLTWGNRGSCSDGSLGVLTLDLPL